MFDKFEISEARLLIRPQIKQKLGENPMSNTSTTTRVGRVYNKPTKVGSSGDDIIKGTRGNEKIYGKAGDDWLYGRPGNDHLFGGSGDDILEGGIGRDILNGGPGIDILTGGGGKDTFILAVNHDHRLEDEHSKGNRF